MKKGCDCDFFYFFLKWLVNLWSYRYFMWLILKILLFFGVVIEILLFLNLLIKLWVIGELIEIWFDLIFVLLLLMIW